MQACALRRSVPAQTCWFVMGHELESSMVLCIQAFRPSARGMFSSISPASQTVSQWEAQMNGALDTKKRAREEFWFLQDPKERYYTRAMLHTEDGQMKRYRDVNGNLRRPKSDRLRKLFIFVMEEKESKMVVGTCSVCLARPEAALPPPFPTTKPFRCYASNIVVDARYRRRGFGRQLLKQCERIAYLWGESALWIHVEQDNYAALDLYYSEGYRRMDYFPLYGNGKLMLMKKDLKRAWRDKATSAIKEMEVGKRVGDVFVWDP